jgi:hypothetical protein
MSDNRPVSRARIGDTIFSRLTLFFGLLIVVILVGLLIILNIDAGYLWNFVELADRPGHRCAHQPGFSHIPE